MVERGATVQPTKVEKERIVELVRLTKSLFVERIPNEFIEDMAFVGNSSGIYPWEPAKLVDLDVCLFVRQKDIATGQWLADVRDELKLRIAELDADFDCRIIVGPYKPSLEELERPFIFVHLAVFLESEYKNASRLLRWAWRKYECLVRKDRLNALAPPHVSKDDVVAKVFTQLEMIERGETTMREWLLPTFAAATIEITADNPNFAEVCFSSVATCMRHHARALGRAEADALENREFFHWYTNNIAPSEALAELAVLKERTRNEGFGAMRVRSRVLAITCLRELAANLAI